MSAPPVLHEGQFAGQVNRAIDVSRDVTVYELCHEPLQVVGTHEHELARIGVMVEGTLAEQSDETCDEIGPGTVVLWAPGATHENRFGASFVRSVQVELSDRMFARVQRVFPAAATTVLGEELFEGAVRTLLSEVRRLDSATPMALEGAIYSVIARAHRVLAARDAPSRDVLRATGYIARNYHRRLTVSELGAYLGLSSRTLTERFQEELGLSPGEYVRRARLEAAASSLATSATPLGEIALACGFYDQAHLTREFHRRFGETPRAYRNRHRSR